MNKKQFAFMTTLLFFANNFIWLVWQHFLNEGLYDMPFFLIWIPVMILAMTAVFFFVFLRKREKKRSPFYFIWSFFLSTAEFGVLLFFHYVFDLFTGGRSPAVCFIIIMAAFYFAAFNELAAFIVTKPAPTSERRLRKRVHHTKKAPAARTKITASGVARFLRIWGTVLPVLIILEGFAVLFIPASDINRTVSFFIK